MKREAGEEFSDTEYDRAARFLRVASRRTGEGKLSLGEQYKLWEQEIIDRIANVRRSHAGKAIFEKLAPDTAVHAEVLQDLMVIVKGGHLGTKLNFIGRDYVPHLRGRSDFYRRTSGSSSDIAAAPSTADRQDSHKRYQHGS